MGSGDWGLGTGDWGLVTGDWGLVTGALEPFIRRVVREELATTKSTPDVFHLQPGSPLYEDMENILQRKAEGKLELFSHEEVWSE